MLSSLNVPADVMSFFSKALTEYSKQFVISVVLGKDLVPR